MRKHFWRNSAASAARRGDFKHAAIKLVADQFGQKTSYDVWRWWKSTFHTDANFALITEQLTVELLRYFQRGSYGVRQMVGQMLGGKSLKIAPKTSVGGLLDLLHKRDDSIWPIPTSVESLAPPPLLPNLAPVVSKFRWNKSPARSGKLVVDLRCEAAELRSLFLKCAEWYAQRAKEISMPNVCAIGAGFYICQSGWLRPYFELNPKRTFANWASSEENEIVRLSHWRKIHNQAQRSGGEFILPNGRAISVTPDVSCEHLAAIFGGVIRDVLRGMRKARQFEKLPLRQGWYLFVDEFDGLWGWRENSQP